MYCGITTPVILIKVLFKQTVTCTNDFSKAEAVTASKHEKKNIVALNEIIVLHVYDI